MNMLMMFSEKYHFNNANTTVKKATTALSRYWNETIISGNSAKKSKDLAQ